MNVMYCHYLGIELFKNGQRIHNPADIPGVSEGGWYHNVSSRGTSFRDRTVTLTKTTNLLKALFEKVCHC